MNCIVYQVETLDRYRDLKRISACNERLNRDIAWHTRILIQHKNNNDLMIDTRQDLVMILTTTRPLRRPLTRIRLDDKRAIVQQGQSHECVVRPCVGIESSEFKNISSIIKILT